ncbi:MAG: response regulator [Candidatus Velamenicoccus archaeovorus]
MGNEKLKILIVEDDPADAELMVRQLVRGGLPVDVRRVDDEDGFRSELATFAPDVILSDFRLPGFGGQEALRIVRMRDPDLPFIFVSGTIGEDVAVETLKQGATDYLLKSGLARLVPAVTRAMADLEELTERRRLEAEVEAAREAERANRAKTEFLSRMSHELRTPLHAIVGFTQLLEMSELDPEQRDSVRRIGSAGEHLLKLIDEILEIGRIEAGHLSLSMEPVATRDVVADAVALIGPLAAARGVEVVAGPDRCPHRVRADRQRLEQVLLNLLSNAVKYNRPGGTVTIGCRGVGGGRVRVEVSDTGPGIPPEHLDRVFEPFDRLGVETTADAEGTGLGLPLSRHLAEAMGGTLGVESMLGQGSTFWIELTEAQDTDATDERSVEAPVSTPTLHPRPERPGTVLYIEDNLSNVSLVERILARIPGVKLLPAMQGSLGLDLARQHRPDLILLDSHLPDIPGSEVLRRLRADPETCSIPVIVVTADASDGQAQSFLASGATAHLTKPFDVRELVELVEANLGRRSVDR